MKYRKKVVVVEGIQWNGHNRQELMDWAKAVSVSVPFRFDEEKVVIPDLGANQIVGEGGWVLHGDRGFFAVDDGVFRSQYERVEDAGGK